MDSVVQMETGDSKRSGSDRVEAYRSAGESELKRGYPSFIGVT